ncbi:MAG TPA: ABC transporter permease [Candidatus Acidoferrales bacterium]|nr:ABC transporter permease [Candidatus Acidoferrales bacterium]
MNWKTFLALLGRDAHVARRNILPVLVMNLIQPMMFVFVFGRIMTGSGLLPQAYKNMLLPGIMAITMVISGAQGVAMPLIAEFQFTKEIEDRLLSPIHIAWIAVEKIVAGMLQALTAGLVVIPAGWLLLGSGLDLSGTQPLVLVAILLLVALMASASGLVLGCLIGQTQVGMMFTLVLGPMIFFGCAYYPWSKLASFPMLQKAVLVNPLVYASEGFRAAMVPGIPHIGLPAVLAALIAFDVVLLWLGIRSFDRKAIG